MKKYILNPKTKFLIFLFILGIIFRAPIKDVFDSLIVTPILQKIIPSYNTDILFCIIICALLVQFISSINKKTIINNDWCLIGGFWLIGYFWCRTNSVYIYVGTFNVPKIAYSDLLLLVVLFIWTLKLKELITFKKEPPYSGLSFLMDQPSSVDSMNRKDFAKRLAQRIEATMRFKESGAMAIAISGAWGSGKTTFLQLIEQSIDKQNRIIFHFNPWRSRGTDNILEDFFELLNSELKIFDANLSKSIYAYAKSLTKIDDNIATRMARTVSDLFDNRNKNDVYNSINESIKDIKKQIIVFIDDLDRLDQAEILQVLKLIRNTANFNSTVYVVAFDKEYVQEAVKSFNSYNYKFFLEKIFQFEFQLPIYDSKIIRKFLTEQTVASLSENMTSIIEAAINTKIKETLLSDRVIKTQRDAIRLVNSMLFEYEKIGGELFFYDFYLLQLLKLKFSNVYRAIIDFRAIFFINEDIGKSTVRLRFMNEAKKLEQTISQIMQAKNGNKVEPSEEHKTIFDLYIQNQKDSGKLLAEEATLISDILGELLDTKREINKGYKNDLIKIFARADNIYKYFAFDLAEGEISIEELEKHRRLPYEEYKPFISSLILAGRTRPLFECLCLISEFSGKDEFENHIKAIFLVGSNLQGYHYTDGIDYSKIIEITTSPIKRKAIRFYEQPEQYREFILTILKERHETMNFTANFTSRILESDLEFPLTEDELATILIITFKAHLEKKHPFTSNFWNMYHCCKIKTSESSEPMLNPLAKEIAMASFHEKAIDEDLKIFIKRSSPGSDWVGLHGLVVDLFMDDNAKLEDWLTKSSTLNKSSGLYQEFMDFFNATKQASWRSVKYDFHFIQVEI